ncbi:hypothetical protein VTH06DRAFT_7924 [Thermothelomyces fergusii]
MAVEGATQALVAAFFFGIVLNAASAALVLFVKGYGLSAIFRDSQRLVLVLFLLSAALWAQIDFVAILLDITTSSVPCQVGIVFATGFDQLARFSVEQFLLWAINVDNGAKLSVMQLIPQVLVLARFLAGAVFIGFTRPQTDDFCVATTSVLPVGILVSALDGAIILLLIIRAYSSGGAAKENRGGRGVKADRARALMVVLLGLVCWTGTSVPMLLGLTTVAFAARTALPAGGLLVLIVFIAGGADTLLAPRKASSNPPEAPSPRRLNISRDVSTSDTDYPPTRFEDLKEAALRSSRTFVNPREVPKIKDETGIGLATETSTWTESVSDVQEIQPRSGKTLLEDAGEAGTAWLRAFGGNDGADSSDGSQPRQQANAGKRGTPPVVPLAQPRVSAWTETSHDNLDDEGTSWSSIDTPEVAIGVPVVRRIDLPAAIQMPKRQDARESQLSSTTDSGTRETFPIMSNVPPAQKVDARGSPAPKPKVPVATPQLPTWHRRVGDQCPTFSVRKSETKARKMPPPAPLPLHTISIKKVLAVHQAEPSPLESPAEAIRQIQAQLRKLDDLPHNTPESATRRMELLKDLEREMGQQAKRWEEIKHDMGRDSMSTMQSLSSTVRDSRHTSVASALDTVRTSEQRGTGPEHWASRKAQVGGDRHFETSARDSLSPKLSKWQKRLTEAQMDYMDAKLLTASNVAFVQLSKAQLASPSPPDSDNSEISPLPTCDEGIPAQRPAEETRRYVSLWKPAPEVAAPIGLLWTAPLKSAPEPEAPLPGLSLRPAQRKELPPLQIESKQLWRKPYNTASRAPSGLWRPLWASAAPPAEPLNRVPSKSGSASRKPPRPAIQRPPRRNRRLTLLPDILESPEPLPDKRGALGIFQFPWGEKSDMASIQPRQNTYVAMPGTMASGGPAGTMAGSMEQPAPADYSSSFFDEYDDDDDEDDDDELDVGDLDSYMEDSNDELDDSTLWEIAGLLKTDSVPSRDRLFLTPFEPVVDGDTDELSSDGEEASIVIGLDAPLEALSEQQGDSSALESSTLLVLRDVLESKTSPQPSVSAGLPPHPKASLDGHGACITSGLTPMAGHTTEAREIKTANARYSAGLWNPPSPVSPPLARDGLFVPGRAPSDYRSTSEEPAALVVRRTPRPVDQRPLERLTSTKLWATEDAVQKPERSWILGERPMLRATRAWRPHFSPEDWQAALCEAIQASRSVTRKSRRRIDAPKTEWEATPIAIADQQPPVAVESQAEVDFARLDQVIFVSERPKERPTTESKEVRAVSPSLWKPARDRQGGRLLLWEAPVPAAVGMSTGSWSAESELSQPVAVSSMEEGNAKQPFTTGSIDWLHSVCVSRPKGAAPTSTQKLWTALASSVAHSSPDGLWTAPSTDSRPSSSLLLSEDVSAAAAGWTMHNRRRRQETPAHDEVQRGTRMWCQKSSSVVSGGPETRRDWLHSTCVGEATVSETRREKEWLWTAPLRSVVEPLPGGLWTIFSCVTLAGQQHPGMLPRRLGREGTPATIACVSSTSASAAPVPKQLLWTGPASSSGTTRSAPSTGLWAAEPTSTPAVVGLGLVEDEEDGVAAAAAARARRRKAVEERGADPAVCFPGMGISG